MLYLLRNSKEVENETRLLFQCSAYSMQWQKFFYDISEILPDIERESTKQTRKLLMNSEDYTSAKKITCLYLYDNLAKTVTTVYQ